MKSNFSQVEQASKLEGQDRLLDLPELASRLTVSKRSVWRLVASGDLVPPVKIGHSVRWFEADIRTYLDKKRQQRDSTVVACSRHRGEL